MLATPAGVPELSRFNLIDCPTGPNRPIESTGEFRRLSNPLPLPADIDKAISGKSNYLIAPTATGWTVTVRRTGCHVETIEADTRPRAIILPHRLADNGLVGYVINEGGAH